MYQWFILVKYQKYIFLLEAQKNPLSGGLRDQVGEGRNKKPGAGPGFTGRAVRLWINPL